MKDSDLVNAELAVEKEKKSIQGIKKQQLTEVRSMVNPSELVKLTMSSVCTLLGHQTNDWRAVGGIIRRDDFILSIINYTVYQQHDKSS